MILEEKISFADRVFEIKLYDAISEVGKDWHLGDFDSDVFLAKEYLQALEDNPPVCLKFCYCMLFENGRALGKFYFQYKLFSGRSSLTYNKAKGFKNQLIHAGKKFVALFLKTQGLVLGNLLVTGNHGHEFLPELFTREEEWKLIKLVTDSVMKKVRQFGWKPKVFLAKDFFLEEKPLHLSWNEVKVQPNMILPLDTQWQNFDDYLATLKSKYKKRTKSALRRKEDLIFRELSLEEVKNYQDEIGRLYRQIVDRASFNMFFLEKEYFYNIKKYLKKKCIITGVFKDEKLIAFQSNIINGDHLEAHFLGYDPAYIKSHDLYLNLLLSTLSQAINLDVSFIVLSRTAMQIKSSIGAVPFDMTIHVKHRKEWMDRRLSSLIDRFNPEVVFDQRHPFKEAVDIDLKSLIKHPRTPHVVEQSKITA